MLRTPGAKPVARVSVGAEGLRGGGRHACRENKTTTQERAQARGTALPALAQALFRRKTVRRGGAAEPSAGPVPAGRRRCGNNGLRNRTEPARQRADAAGWE